MNYSTEIETRFADLDAYGHVNNAVFFTYLETARVKLFQRRYAELLQGGLLFLVVEASCSYRKPIELGERVQIDISTEHVGGSSFTLAYRMHNGDGQEFAEARTVMVCFDAGRNRPRALPDELRADLSGSAAASGNSAN